MKSVLRPLERALQKVFARLGCFYFPVVALAIIAWIWVAIFLILPPSASTVMFVLVVFGGAFVVTWLLFLPFLAFDRDLKDTNQQHLRSGGAWAEWTYSPEEWQAFVATEQTQLGKDALGLLVVCVLLGGISTLMTGLIIRSALATLIAVCLSFGLALFLLIRESNAVNRRRNLRGPVTVRLNGLGIDEEGTYTQLVGFGQVLEEATIATGNPSILRLVSRSHNGKHTVRSVVRIPVPHGCEAEADALIARLMHPTADSLPPTSPERGSRALA